MDNHESHCSLDAILFARENGIVLVTFPPHCSHRLQPLDVGILGPFKSKLKIAENDWLLSNPGKTVTIHNLAALTNTAYIASFTPKNITAAFKATGTWPLSRLVFTEEDFEASHVISTPINNTSVFQHDLSSPSVNRSPVVSCTTENQPSTSKENSAVLCCTPEKSKHCETNTSMPKGSLTPEDVWPFPKAEARRKIGGRRKGKSSVLTETPEKNRVEEETLKRLEKKSKLSMKKIKFEKINTKVKRKPARNCFNDESSDSEGGEILLQDESDCEELEQFLISTTSEFEENVDFGNDDDVVIQINDFVLVQFAGKKNKVLFVGQVEDKEEDNY